MSERNLVDQVPINKGLSKICIKSQYSFMFPYSCFQCNQTRWFNSSIIEVPTEARLTAWSITKMFNSFRLFPKLYALETSNLSNVGEKQATNIPVVGTSNNGGISHPYEALARLYIEKETGRERLRALFHKNHLGESSPEMFYFKMSLIEICVIGFFIGYIPSWYNARQDFIREHNATAFRTRIEAVRKMNDTASYKAILDGVSFATRITSFSAAFLFLSQAISSHRNKTSVLEYTIAAGITGGFGRIHMGPKGFVAGSFVGIVLGTMFGCVASALLHLTNLTQDARHLQHVIARMEFEKSVIGDQAFEEKMKKLTEGLDINLSPV